MLFRLDLLHFISLMVFIVVAAGTTLTASAEPIVSNVTAAQRADGSGLVDIYYDVADGVPTMKVVLAISSDNGSTWDITPTTIFGDIGTGITNGTGKHIIWDAQADQPDVCWPDMGVRITAMDEVITILLPGDVPLVLVKIPAGTFMMGRYAGEQDSFDREDTQHSVTLNGDFYMGKYEVTKGQWQAVMGTTPWSGQDYVLDDLDSPVVYVSWDDAHSFITALNIHITNTGQGVASMCLPSEAQREYACRAGSMQRFYWGDDLSYTEIDDYAWWDGTADNMEEDYAHVVGGKLPNVFGLYDMIGNAWEWCEDDWHSDYTGAPTDGSAWLNSPRASTRVARGGGWSSAGYFCRSATRNDGNLQTFTNYNMGFRLVR
ncbi:MAG: formylglycine-generating enzyme family protein [Candidatus Hydrogenedentes bacterium]|nr:formylglycine-generating enzyme family protein [Candidatus Hydrogenedentota bacterium]